MSRNVLDLKKSHQLTAWLNERIADLRELPLQRVADVAAEGLGFAVTVANVRTVRDAFDLDLGRHQPTPPDQAQIVEELRLKVAELTHQIHIIAGAFRLHLEDHGVTDIPPGLNGVSAMPSQLSL